MTALGAIGNDASAKSDSPHEPANRPPVLAGEPVALNRIQRLIGQRMLDSVRSIPHFDVEIDVDFDAAAELRRGLGSLEIQKPSFNDMIIKASALALRDFPYLNAAFEGETICLQDQVNIGVAVAAPESLLVPVVLGADRLRLSEIASQTRRLALSARSGQLLPSELAGGTFTVSNLGMYGVLAISSIINQPQTAILGVGAIRDQLARRNGTIVDVRVCRLRLSCDHRIVYGAAAAEFLSRVAHNLEQPLALLA